MCFDPEMTYEKKVPAQLKILMDKVAQELDRKSLENLVLLAYTWNEPRKRGC